MPKRSVVSFADDIASGSGTNKRIALSNEDGDEFDLPEGDDRQTEREVVFPLISLFSYDFYGFVHVVAEILLQSLQLARASQ
ncbi:unnamed protein product [Strongylus vulgaris]|uniref:Uncharacterized protein n=1 Tax=Strongylus vulgaris TaxID=40348 RepID=A0A3P7J8P4_STRVU|nr:unnamed protein product [Strongylus vulgaris]